MSFRLPVLAALAGISVSAATAADDLRDFCADRPGNGTPACIVDKGHAMLEVGLADWTHDRSDGVRTDEIDLGEALLRYGIGTTTEIQLGWTAYGHIRTKDETTGAITRQSGSGDVTIALRKSLLNPDGTDLSISAMPFVTLPTGGDAIGAGRYTAGLILPVDYQLSNGLSLAFTGEVDDAADGGGDGHHAAYSATVGLGIPLTDHLAGSLELTAGRDLDPSGHATDLSTAVSLAWQADNNLQLDIGSNFGLNRQTPDAQLYAGIATRF